MTLITDVIDALHAILDEAGDIEVVCAVGEEAIIELHRGFNFQLVEPWMQTSLNGEPLCVFMRDDTVLKKPPHLKVVK